MIYTNINFIIIIIIRVKSSQVDKSQLAQFVLAHRHIVLDGTCRYVKSASHFHLGGDIRWINLTQEQHELGYSSE